MKSDIEDSFNYNQDYSEASSFEFEQNILKFGSFVNIAKRQKYNFLALLKLLIEDKKTQKLLCELLGEYNLQIIIRAYLNITPNVYKKIFRSKFNKRKINSNHSSRIDDDSDDSD